MIFKLVTTKVQSVLRLAAFLVLVVGATLGVGAQRSVQAEWTLMFYMDADNDLEDPQMVDLVEMMSAGSNAKVNIIVLADRSVQGDGERGYTNRAVGGIRPWTTAKLLRVEAGKLTELADWGEVNMGDPATLTRFLRVVSKEYPANKFGLVFGDHGEGWKGIVSDESAGSDSLNTVELPAALNPFTAGAGKLEFIGFDACLMANFELVKTVAPFAKTMVGSEELEPGDGWNYGPTLKALRARPQMGGQEFGRIVADNFRDYYTTGSEGGRDNSITLSVIDLNQVPALETAVSSLGVRNAEFMKSAGRESWIKTSKARSNTEEYGQGEDGEEGSFFFDLVDYSENLKRARPDSETVKAADAVIAAVKAAVVYSIKGAARPRSSGISIFFPAKKQSLVGEGYLNTPFSKSGKWLPFLNDFTGGGLNDKQAPKIGSVDVSEPVMAKTDVVVVTSKVDADDLEEATFVLAEAHDDGEIIIGAFPTEPDENGLLREEWDGSWFSIGDGRRELICPITDFEQTDEGSFYLEVPAQVRIAGQKVWRDVSLFFFVDTRGDKLRGEFVYAYDFSGQRAREFELEPGDSVRPVYLAIGTDGSVEEIASNDEADILKISKDDGLTIGEMEVAAGKYLIGFVATDFAGNNAEEFTEVTIED